MTTAIERQQLRQRLREQRANLPAAQRIAAAQGLLLQLQQLPELVVDERIGGYFAVNGELSLHLLVAQCWRRGKAFHLPVATPPRRLRFARYDAASTVQPNRYGIPEPVAAGDALIEPAALELVFVPLLGFDRRGHRLGYGGGYYDSSFAFLQQRERPAQPLLVGVGYSFQEVDALAPESWDVQLDLIATERELIDCTGVA
ncbi:5-formyltetrahydrofolate cyclo-ligase [Tahibacter caeni]|uniref:5-formyltetrahydrofolate cyclo-ligase n=1 Tax=Tahibacter caeni TaxID=1453545 RepID=UPI0021498D76|nr:5-formyltetrahydrofolate cyclo-ligase [Tahibacter caeni]